MTVKRTFNFIPQSLREWTRFFDDLLFMRSFVTTLTGCTTSPTGTVYYTVSAGIAVLRIPSISATSNSTASTLTNLPAEITPVQSSISCIGRVTDNGTTAFGIYRPDPSGVITLYPNAALGNFTNAGTKGTANSDFAYLLE